MSIDARRCLRLMLPLPRSDMIAALIMLFSPRAMLSLFAAARGHDIADAMPIIDAALLMITPRC